MGACVCSETVLKPALIPDIFPSSPIQLHIQYHCNEMRYCLLQHILLTETLLANWAEYAGSINEVLIDVVLGWDLPATQCMRSASNWMKCVLPNTPLSILEVRIELQSAQCLKGWSLRVSCCRVQQFLLVERGLDKLLCGLYLAYLRNQIISTCLIH